jgi:hypothetical protein
MIEEKVEGKRKGKMVLVRYTLVYFFCFFYIIAYTAKIFFFISIYLNFVFKHLATIMHGKFEKDL